MSKFQSTVAALMANNFTLEKQYDSLLVLTDKSTEQLGVKFKEALATEQWHVNIHVMDDRKKSGEEPPKDAAEEMLKYQLVFCLTKYSLTHTEARKQANKNGISVITMPGITEDMFYKGAMSANYKIVEKETITMAEKLSKYNHVTIYTGNNYQLSIPIKNREGIASTGVFLKAPESGNLPSGEAYIAPNENEAQGKIEITGSISGIGLVDEPVVLTISKGRLIKATGKVGETLLQILGNSNGRLLCELGIGTNYAARLTGNILEDEKAYNTVHVAFGSNHTFGGTIHADVHIDCVTKNPKIIWG